MKKHTISLGDLVATAYDHASQAVTDPREVSQLAHRTVEQVLRQAGRAAPLHRR